MIIDLIISRCFAEFIVYFREIMAYLQRGSYIDALSLRHLHDLKVCFISTQRTVISVWNHASDQGLRLQMDGK